MSVFGENFGSGLLAGRPSGVSVWRLHRILVVGQLFESETSGGGLGGLGDGRLESDRVSDDSSAQHWVEVAACGKEVLLYCKRTISKSLLDGIFCATT